MRAAARALAGAACALTLIAAPVASGAGGDPKAGEAIYSRCAACHALAYDRTGPRHCGLFGRHAGALPGFDYSAAMQRSRIVWDEATLDRFLADPLRTVPGTAMGYAGIKDPTERSDLIAYLKAAGRSPRCASPSRRLPAKSGKG
jgi:cytochrome c